MATLENVIVDQPKAARQKGAFSWKSATARFRIRQAGRQSTQPSQISQRESGVA
jgi:hypothetical protein